MIGVYFSGTGNTKFCIERLLNGLDKNGSIYSIENDAALDAIADNEQIIFAYPVYYSNLPKIVRDFIVNHAELWRGKKVFVLATMGLFSGDGAGCAARLFKKYGAKVLGGLHIKMPDCIGDVKLLKKSLEDNRKIVSDAERKIDKAVNSIQSEKYPKQGLNFAYRITGLFGQRLYFRGKTKNYYKNIKINNDLCIACGVCVSLCPMKNIEKQNNNIVFKDKCTMCYRCFSNCPKKAITIIGKQVYEQCTIDKYKN